MKDAFMAGGWGMWPTLIFGLLCLAVSIRYAMRPEKRFVPLLICTNVMTLIAGSLGFVTGMIATTTYLAADDLKQPAIALIGMGESLHNVSLALILMMLAAIAATIGAFRHSQSPQPA